MKRCVSVCFICILLMLSLHACASERREDTLPGEDGSFLIYYVNHDGNGIGAEPYEPVSDPQNTQAMVEEILAELGNNPLRLAYHAPLTGDIALSEYRLDADGLLTLDFDTRYLETDHVTEILDRAAIVRTLTQIEGVTGVLFLVSGTSLMTGRDEPVGVMDADTF
ncbi:MAG: GerMN domain-containing protein, partial [Butyrivibrio sp.]|nr:GerMN domain-containing protein [Butyrivibrio sp.]